MPLPNLLIIGAAKAGTTSLHNYLNLHPQIAMSVRKELEFFTRDDWRDGLDWYAEQFSAAKIMGESSPTYTMRPYLPSTAPRISAVIPHARLIYVLRDPLERCIAHYVEHVHLGVEKRPLAEALLDSPTDNPYLCASRYASQLEPFYEEFPRDHILLVDHGELRASRERVMSRIFDFLGVEEFRPAPGLLVEHNTGDTKVRYNAVGMWMIRHGVLTKKVEGFERGPLIRPVRHLLSRPVDRRLNDDDRERVVDLLRADVNLLRATTGLPWPWPSFG